MLFLVTGGAGFIGSHTVEELLKKGYKVRVLDNFSTGKEENLKDFPGLEVIKGDITKREVLKRAVKGVQYIIHLAALTSVFRSLKAPKKAERVNIFGTLSLLLEAKEAKIERFIYASSSSVYGDTPTLPKRVSMNPSPLSPYAISKLTAEYYCRIFYSLYGLETISLRYFNVYGERQDPLSPYSAVIPKFISSLIKGKRVLVVEDGPTVTHGGMEYGAGMVAAENNQADEIIDPRPYSIGFLKEIFRKYSHLEKVLPAMGYGQRQMEELERVINRIPCDSVILATPARLEKFLKINKPCANVRYEFKEIGDSSLEKILDRFLRRVQDSNL